MLTFKLTIKTFTPCGNFICIENQFIALHKGYIYFIDIKKLDFILSLMKILLEFNEYISNTNEYNITEWMKEKGLATTELFAEISFYRLKYKYDEQISGINSFFKEKPEIFNKENIEKKFCILLKESLKDIILFNFFSLHKDSFNNYVKNLLSFFEQNPRCLFSKPNSFKFFINCIIEMDKLKLSDNISQIEKLKIYCNIQENFEKYFSIEKIISPTHTFYQECLQKNVELKFKITCAEDNFFYGNIDKFMQLYETINFLRIKQEKEFLMQKTSVFARHADNLNYNEIFDEDKINLSNFSFIDSNKMLFLNLNENNKKRINRLLLLNRLEPILDKEFYFICAPKNKLKFLNYAKIKI